MIVYIFNIFFNLIRGEILEHKIDYTLSVTDYVVGYTYVQEHDKQGKESLFLFKTFGFLILIGTVGLMDVMLEFNLKAFYVTFLIISLILWFSVARKLHHQWLNYKMKKYVQQHQTADWFEDRSLQLTDEHCIFQYKKQTIQKPWTSFRALKENESYFYIYEKSQPVYAHIIPKRAIQQVEAFRKFIEERISK